MSNTEDKTLCALQEEGYIASNQADFIKLIQPASYFCNNCGRSAVNENNLCNPQKLDQSLEGRLLLRPCYDLGVLDSAVVKVEEKDHIVERGLTDE